MDNKMEIKHEDPFSCEVASQNEGHFLQKHAAVLLDIDCDNMTVKSGTHFSDFCVQKGQATRRQENQIKSETATWSNNLEINTKTEIEGQTLVSDFVSQNERKFLPGHSVIKKKHEYSSDHEVDNKVEIKEERWWQQIQTSAVCDDIKDEDFPPVTSTGSWVEATSADNTGKSPLPSIEDLTESLSVYVGKDSPAHEYFRNSKSQGIYITEKHLVEINIYSEPPRKYDDGKTYRKATQMLHECVICGKRLTRLSDLKRHNLVHVAKKAHKCEICSKRFTHLSSLKTHNLIREGKKQQKCEICERRFTLMSSLKRHTLIHEGKKPHKCTICEKRFTAFSNLKIHYLIHEGKKPHRCAICDKRFTQLSHLNS